MENKTGIALAIVIVVLSIWSIVNACMLASSMANTIMPDKTSIIVDKYFSNDGFIEIKPNGYFVESINGVIFNGRYSGKFILPLDYENGTTKKMCVLYNSDRLMMITDKCKCSTEVVSKKDCMDGIYFRRGSLPEFLQ
jgi:hypothetical protein